MPNLNRFKMRLLIAQHTMPVWLLKPLNTIRTIGALARNFTLSLYELSLAEDQGETKIGYLGPGYDLKFIASLVDEKKTTGFEPKAKVTLFETNKIVRQMRQDYDLVVVQLPYMALSRLPRDDSFSTIRWVNWYVDTQQPWEEIYGAFHKDALESIRKMNGVEADRTYNEADLEAFYREIYRPYVKQRFGALAIPVSYEVMHYCFSQGWLDWYRKEDLTLGGGVSYITAGILHNHVLGFKEGISSKVRSEVSTARYYYSIQRAAEASCQALNLAHTYPILSDGLARYKRKWGAFAEPDPSENWGFWVGLGRDVDKARRFMTKHVWLWLDHQRQARGLIVENSEQPMNVEQVDKLCQRMWNPGLKSIILHASAGFEGIPLSESPLSSLGPAVEWKENH